MFEKKNRMKISYKEKKRREIKEGKNNMFPFSKQKGMEEEN